MYTKNQSTIYRQQTISSTQYVDLVIFSRQKIKIFNKKKDFLAKIKPFVEMLEIFRFFYPLLFWTLIHNSYFLFLEEKKWGRNSFIFRPKSTQSKKKCR